jgi:Mrp family chromosome partitioning ATPase
MSSGAVHGNPPGDSAHSEVQLLRAFVEREIPGRSVILVTSARDGDGKSLTAYSLADCLARAGRRTALVDGTTESSSYVRIANTGRGEGDGDLALYVPAATTRTPLFRDATQRFVENMRALHEFTIIDGAALLTSEMAMALAESVDAVLLSVRLGRPPSIDDESTSLMLDRSASRVLGVVAASPEAIDEYERRGAPQNAGADAQRSPSPSWIEQIRRAWDGGASLLRRVAPAVD